ncbi:MAG TPA: protein phosphatase 2C domain-containing protein [Gemmatimonadales bacterium]|jgi:protein phosphatase
MTAPQTTAPSAALDRKPRDEEIDVHGITHPGKVRTENQDHFLICALKKQMVVRLTSLPEVDQLTTEPERLAFLMMVADGVGGGVKGAEASRVALEAVANYVSSSMRCYYAAGSADDREFSEALEEGALQCHMELLRRGQENPDYRGMATTLTLYLGVWPRAYLLQVGDSRCYLLRRGELTQITRDQTMAQELVELGVLTRADASTSRLAHTLSSSIGGSQTAPVVTRLDVAWGNVALLCSDGLTKHVPDERIRERLRSMTSAPQVCEDLLQDALEGGGTDNITIIVARALRSES